MFILGLVLIVLGVVAIIGGVTGTSGTASFLGFDDIAASAIFFIGLGSGVAIVLGLSLVRFGTKRSLKNRREQKRLTKLNEQLDRNDHENRRDSDEDRPTTI